MQEPDTEHDDPGWNEVTSAGEGIWRRLAKDVLVGFAALLCFAVFMVWPHPWVVVGGIVVIIALAWISESRSGIRTLLPVKGRSVIITGCDTGNFHQHLKWCALRNPIAIVCGCA